MKYILSIAFLLLFSSAFAQTLTFKSVETSRSSDYEEYAKLFLGKKVNVKLFDNSVSLQLQGDKEIIYLQKTQRANLYMATRNRAATSVILNYTMGVLSSIDVELDKLDNKGMIERYTKATAKRF